MSQPPLLVIDAMDRLRWVPWVAYGFVVATLVGTFLAAEASAAPWLPEIVRSFIVLVGSAGKAWRVLVVLATVGGWVAHRYALPRRGRIEFRGDGIEFQKPGFTVRSIFFMGIEHTRSFLKWTDTTGYSDAAADYVQIRKGKSWSKTFTIPTSRDEERIAVLDILVARGVPRID